jgi:predicted dehydrogenase
MSMRAAVIGSGFMGRVHLEALRRLGAVEPFAVASRDAEAVRRALADPNVHAVHICTPNASHLPLVQAALEAGKHVVCEKPLATSAAEAQRMLDAARRAGLRHCTNQNLRYYPMVQHMRRMREAGELGDILAAQGTYSQDWLLFDTDWNWRIDAREGGPSRTLADIGTHWCDMLEHITGLRITAVCADLQTFHKTRRRPRGVVETFAGKTLRPEDYQSVPVDTEDFASVIFRLGDRARGAYTVSQVSAGCKNRLSIEIYGTRGSVAWNQERPDELWIGQRNQPNRLIVKDPSLLQTAAQSYADLPGGHSEGYDDTFKQVFRRFYASVADPHAPVEYPQFDDGLRQLRILEAELASHQRRTWVEVPA